MAETSRIATFSSCLLSAALRLQDNENSHPHVSSADRPACIFLRPGHTCAGMTARMSACSSICLERSAAGQHNQHCVRRRIRRIRAWTGVGRVMTYISRHQVHEPVHPFCALRTVIYSDSAHPYTPAFPPSSAFMMRAPADGG